MTDKPEDSPHHRADIEVSQDGDKVMLQAPAGGVALTAGEAQELASRLFEAAIFATGENPEENDWVRVPMQYIRAAAERMELSVEGAEPVQPNEDPEMGDARNAEVHCWIKDQTQQNAMHIAAGSIAEHGWVMLEVLEQRPAARADFTDTEYLQYYEQALIDSEVFLYELEETEGEEEGTADAS
jgi:hypothetical protein